MKWRAYKQSFTFCDENKLKFEQTNKKLMNEIIGKFHDHTLLQTNNFQPLMRENFAHKN